MSCRCAGGADPPTVVDACGNTLTPTNTPPAAACLRRGYRLDIYYTDCANNTADWTYTYTVDMPPSPSVLRQVCPRELSCRCAGGADPPTVVDAVVTPDADQYAAGRRPCLRRGYRLDIYLYDCATTPRLDLYYTVDMRPSPSVLRRFVHRELSCRCVVAPTPQRLSMLW
jgi:hypothetical protein